MRSGATMTSTRKKVTPTPRERTSRAPLLPSNIDHLSAQAELDQFLFPHYLLGRQLALEQVMRELLQAVPPTVRANLIERLRVDIDLAMDRLSEGIADPTDEASTAGYVATLIQQGI